MKLIRTLFVVFAALLLCAGAANAGTLTYSTTVPATPTLVDWTSGWLAPAWSALPQFNEATYGTLDSIEIEVRGTVGPGSISLTNNGSMARDIGITVTLALQVYSPIGSVPTLTATASPWTAFQANAVALGAAPSPYVTNFAQSTITNNAVFTNHSAFTPFLGAGTVSGIEVRGIGSITNVVGGANSTIVTNAPAQALLTVRYNYGGVPEPATFVLLGAGLVVITAIGRKRLAKR